MTWKKSILFLNRLELLNEIKFSVGCMVWWFQQQLPVKILIRLKNDKLKKKNFILLSAFHLLFNLKPSDNILLFKKFPRNYHMHILLKYIFFQFQSKVHQRTTAIYVKIFQNQSETKARGKIGNEQAFGSQHAHNHDFLL